MKSLSPEENGIAPSPNKACEQETLDGNEGTRKRSTLIEFPGVNRGARPPWRQELSERVREIQERRAREADENPTKRRVEFAAQISSGTSLGIVPPTEPADVNPIVAAALKRIERARQDIGPLPKRTVSGRGGATAVARAAEESYDVAVAPEVAPQPITLVESDPDSEILPEVTEAEPVREHKLVVVAPRPAAEALEPEVKPAPRKVVEGVVDDAYLSRLEDQLLPPVSQHEPLENYAPHGRRIAAALLDLVVVAFAISPFASAIELTNGNWGDHRVQYSMAGIVLLVIFLYHTVSLGLTGKTIGMSFFSLRAVDSRTGVHPSTLQSISRAISYIIVIGTAFLGSLSALFDRERRTLHDMLSRTVVVSE